MKKATLKELRDEAQQVYQEYGARFAGKPRATRDLGTLDNLIERLESVVERGRELQNGGRDPALQSILEQAVENLEIYSKERERIAEVQEGGASVVEASTLATWANLLFGQYYRHFAGKPRPTRDLGLLSEIIAALEQVEAQMKALADGSSVSSIEEDLATVRENKSLYEEEFERITDMRETADDEDLASYLALAANEQFQVYRFHFGGKPRVSRRPELLERVIVTLEAIRERMRRLEERGIESDQNAENLQIVDTQLDTYRDELEHIREAKSETSDEEMVGHLGQAANAVMEEYQKEFAGQDRGTRDLELLSRLCDELFDMARQMRWLTHQIDSEANDQNFKIVLDNLMMYQQEWEQIQEVQEG